MLEDGIDPVAVDGAPDVEACAVRPADGEARDNGQPPALPLVVRRVRVQKGRRHRQRVHYVVLPRRDHLEEQKGMSWRQANDRIW